MKREMSLGGQRRSQSNMEKRTETSNDRLTDFTVNDDSDANIKYTSTPLKKIGVGRLQRQFSAPNFDSEESTDAVKTRKRTLKRRKTSRSIRKEGIPGAKIIESADLEGKRRKRSRRRRSEGSKNDLEEGEGNVDFERIGKERNTTRRQGEESVELPIADLLRKAQENQKSMQTKYEEPIPLPELTTDTLYVQGRNGFSAVKIRNFRSEESSTDRLLKPIHIAIKMHNSSKTVALFCQGLLGGIALSLVILVTKIETDSNYFAAMNSTSYGHLMSGIFLFLVTMSLLASMDRIDLANLDAEHVRENFSHRSIMIVTFLLYLAALCIHLSAMNIDGIYAADDAEYALRRQTNTWKFVLCIIGWFFIALGPSDDLTTTHLESLLKYAT